MASQTPRRICLRSGYHASIWSAALLVCAVIAALVFVPATLLAPKMAGSLLIPAGIAAIGGLIHLLRPRTVVDFEAGALRARGEEIPFSELSGVRLQARVSRFRVNGHEQEVELYSVSLLRRRGDPQLLLESPEAREAWRLVRRLGSALQLPLSLPGEPVPWPPQEPAPRAAGEPPAQLLPPGAPKGLSVRVTPQAVEVRLRTHPALVAFAVGVPALMAGGATLLVPPGFLWVKLLVAGIALALTAVFGLAWLLAVGAVALEREGVRLVSRLGSSRRLPRGSRVYARPSPAGGSLLVGSGERLVQIPIDDPAWLGDLLRRWVAS
jgi:hypothetical protein